MKKNKIAVAGICLTLALSAAACGEKKDTDAAAQQSAAESAGETASEAATEETAAEDTAPGVDATIKVEDEISYNAKDYVELGDYMGIKIDVKEPEEVTDAEVEAEMQTRVNSVSGNNYVATDKKVVETGDTVNIDYEGKKDGVAFDGGTAQGYELEIGSGAFIDGFEDGLIGAKVGDTLDLNLTFPEEYHSAELAGQDVVFTVKINSIDELDTTELKDIDDEWVKTNYGADSVDAWKESVKLELEAEKEAAFNSEKNSACLEKLKEICTIRSMPEGLVEERKSQAKETYENQAKANGVDLETLLSFYGTTEEQLDQWIEEFIPDDVENEVIELAIAEDLGITSDSEEYKEYVQGILDSAGYSSEEEIYTVYEKEYVERLFKMEEALNRVAEAAVIE